MMPAKPIYIKLLPEADALPCLGASALGIHALNVQLDVMLSEP